jgi:hypothetical protein
MAEARDRVEFAVVVAEIRASAGSESIVLYQ